MQDLLQLEGLPENLAYLIYSLNRPETILDLLLVSLTFFLILIIVRRSQAAVLLRGLLLLALLTIIISAVLQLPTFTWLLRAALVLALVTTPLVFQPEMRLGLERIGRTFGFLQIRPTELVHRVIPVLVRASNNLSSRRVGALIVLEGSTSLTDVIRTGVPMHASLSADLLETIFEDKTPLHDGAVVVREDQIEAAACVLPLSEQQLPEGMHQGTRHRAALGISEVTDSLALVVSEETGFVSLARHGKLQLNVDATELRDQLYRFYDPLLTSAGGPWDMLALRQRWRQLRHNVSPVSTRRRTMSLLSLLATLLLAILLAVATWLLVANQVNPPITEQFDSIPLRLVNQDRGLVVVSSVPESVVSTVQAPQDIFLSLSQQSFLATADLANLEEGVHLIPVEIEPNDERVRVVSVEPELLNVTLQPRTNRLISVTLAIPDRDSLPFSYEIAEDPVLDPPEVIASGPSSSMDQLAKAEVTVALRSARSAVSEERIVVLKDEAGKVLPDLTASPEAVQVTIPIRQRFGTQDGAVHVVITGTVAPGYWISNVTADPATVTLLGPPSTLNEMKGVVETLPVDVTGAAGNISRRVPLAPPTGVTALNERGVTEGSVEVRITVETQPGNLRITVPVEITGVGAGETVSSSPASVDVLLSGPLPVLNQVNADPKLIRVIVDVSELGTGTQNVVPTLIAPESLKATLVPNTVEIQIEQGEVSTTPVISGTLPAGTAPEPTPVSLP